MDGRAFHRLLFASAVIIAIGLIALGYIVFTVYPVLWARWAFFAALTFTTTGIGMALGAYLHRRFPGAKPTPETTVLREGILLGLYVAALAWLQLGRALSVATATILAVALITIELLILLNEAAGK